MHDTRLVVLVNPRSGGRCGQNVWQQVKPVFDEAGVGFDTLVTEHVGHAAEIAAELDLTNYQGFCLVGGDGTIHEVIGGLMRRGTDVPTPLGLLPGGTGNSVHQHLACLNPLVAARNIVGGHVAPFDLLRVCLDNETTYCANIVGWGAAVDINRTAEWLRPFGPSRYSVAALWHILRAKRRPLRLILDGEVIEDEFLLVMGCNTKFTGKGMLIAPRAELGDGLIDVIIVRQASRRQMLQMFSKVFDGSHCRLPFVEYRQVRSFAIESARQDPLNLDGELKGRTPVSVDVVPGALRIFHGVGQASSQRRERFSG
jgi:diacylglycerol kinase (ATP)